MLPLWAGLIPFAMAYAVLARSAGLSLWHTQLMSLIVFGGSSQFSAAGLFGLGASGIAIVLTTFVINLRHFLYTLALGQRYKTTTAQKLLASHLTTDEAFGLAVSKRGSFPFFLGTAFSLFFIWNLSTLAGSLVSELVPDPIAIGIDFIFPVAFLALLIPLLKTRKELSVAVLAGLAAFIGSSFLNPGILILLVGVAASLLGALWAKDDDLALEETAP